MPEVMDYTKPLKTPDPPIEVEISGGFITVKGKDEAIGYLLYFPSHGVFDANYGRIDVTPEQSRVHNKLLSAAQVKAMDETAKVGESGILYVDRETNEGVINVRTWVGDLVGFARKAGSKLVMQRNGRTWKAKPLKHEQAVSFTRTA